MIQSRPRSQYRKEFRPWLAIAGAVAMATFAAPALADWFGPVRYDPKADRLIVTLNYDGTKPGHQISVQWAPLCKKLNKPGAPTHQTAVWFVDSQGNDLAKKRYTETITVPLAGLSCRPVRVTLYTEPWIPGLGNLDVDIPVASGTGAAP
jgi:hypothetical protein